MEIIKKVFILSLLFLSAYRLSAERSKYSFYYSPQLNEGISQISVLAICQDSKGYLWLGTKNGLNRFNGSEYEVYRKSPGDSLGLSDNHIAAICEEAGRYMWVATSRGLNRLCLTTNKIKQYYIEDGLCSSGLLSLLVDSSNRIWAGSRGGLCLYDPERDCFVRMPVEGNRNPPVTALLEDHAGRIWVGTANAGVYLFSKDFQLISRFSAGTTAGSLSDNCVSTIYEDSYERIWVGCQLNGLNCIDVRNNKVTTYTSRNSGLKNNYVRCLIEWDGELLIGTFDGIYAYDPLTGNIKRVVGYDEKDGSLGHYSIYSFCRDRMGTLWVGTYAGGISYLTTLSSRFVTHDPGALLNIRTGIYGATCYDRGNRLWIGTEGYGLLNYDVSSGSSRFHLIDDSSYSVYNSNVIKSVFAEEGQVWCGTARGEIYRFDTRTKKFNLFYKYPEELSIYSILRGQDGNLWAGGSKGGYELTCFTPSGKVVTSFVDESGKKINLSTIRCLFEEKEGVLLAGSRSNGLIRYDRNRNVTTKYSISGRAGKRIGSNHISSILKTEKGEVWVSTCGAGFFRLDETGQVTTEITEATGLLSNDVFKLLEGVDGTLWMSTSKGITSYSPLTGEITNYPHKNGIDVRELTLYCGTTLPDGTLCFTASDGFVTFYTPDMPVNKYVPPVVLESLKINNTAIRIDDNTGILSCLLDDTPAIRLKHDQNNFSINYKALNFIHSEMNRYAYKLEGYDSGWNEVEERTTAYYTNLKPGKYTFHVRASNNDGIWNEEGKTLEITIVPPVWATWYAYLVYGLLLLTTFYLILHYTNVRRNLHERLALEQREKKQQEEFHQAKIRLFTNFAHELRTPLTLIITPFEELVKRLDLQPELRDKLEIIYTNAQRLLLLVNQLMDLQKNQSGAMELKVTEGNVCEFVKEIYYAFNQIAQTNEIEFVFNCEPKEINAWYDKVLLEKVVFNLLSNAFKYTPPGRTILMDVYKIPYEEIDPGIRGKVYHNDNQVEYLMLKVTDSGCGIPGMEKEKVFTPFYQVPETTGVDVPGTGIGLSLVHSTVNLHKGAISIKDRENESGAVFEVVLPISQTAYTGEERRVMQMETIGNTTLVQPEIPVVYPDVERVRAQKRTILLVEDDKSVREYLKKSLETEYNIIEATNGETGYDKTVQLFPDLVISDIMMPRRNGLELCSLIKNDVRVGHIPVILMTARSMIVHIKEGFQAGADDYIIKPFSMDVLRIRVQSLLQSRDQLKKMYGKRFSPEVTGFNGTLANERFSQKLYEIIEKNIANQNLNVDLVCSEIGISRANFYRKLKAITELSFTELIRNKRLEIALRYLKETELSISEISTNLGFNSHSYFTNIFRVYYGFSPKEYIQMDQKKKAL